LEFQRMRGVYSPSHTCYRFYKRRITREQQEIKQAKTLLSKDPTPD
jgi:hypothetical protein